MATNKSAVPSGNAAPRPEILHPESIPSELKAIPRWLLWRLEDRDGKPSKTPYQVSGTLAKVNDPATWTTFENALTAYLQGGFSGLGIALSGDDDLTGVDLDKCLNPNTGELDPEAARIVADLPTYCEISPSGRGLRLFAFGRLPQGGRRKGKVEMYESGRYLTVTGHQFNGHGSITQCTAELAKVHARIFGTAGAAGSPPVDTKPRPADPLNLDDAALLAKAHRARNGGDFDRLWNGDLSGHGGDASAADLALCNSLGFYTGNDPARMDRLFRQSALFRPKWDKSHYSDGRTYGQATIEKAISGNRETYSGRKPDANPARPADPTGAAGADKEVNDADLARMFQTDLGNSERLVARHGRDLRYCFDFGKWLCWDGVRWAIDRDGAAIDKAKLTARAMLGEAATLQDREDSRKLAAWSFRSQARERLAAALFLAQSDVPVRPERLDTHHWLLNVENGTLDLRAGTLQPADRADLMTKAAPVAYDSTATCPEWLAFLNRIFDGNQELIRYVQKAAGYSLTGDDREQAFFVCYGTGRNGKSTLLETLAAVLGDDYAQQAAPELLMQKTHDRHPTELAALRGMRLVTAIETGEGKRLNEPLVKQLTGGDRISARFMHGDFFTFAPTHKLWLATNHKPTIRGTDLGMWRRIKLIPFTVQIPDEEKDDGLKARLRTPEVRQGILNWMLEGALLWQREGLRPPQAVNEATQAYREEMDVLAAWLADCCVINKRAEAKAADLYKSYCDWCDANGEKPESQRSFGLRLTERGLDRRRGTAGAHRWFGIGLLAPSDPSDPSDPEFNIKEPNSGGVISKPGNRVTSVTSVTNPPADVFSSHLGDSSQTVEGGNSTNMTDFREQQEPPAAPSPGKPRPMVCTWSGLGRLITKCDDPEPNEDQTGCANCGASKPAPGASLNGPHISQIIPDEGLI